MSYFNIEERREDPVNAKRYLVRNSAISTEEIKSVMKTGEHCLLA